MKKIFQIFLLLVVILSLIGCGKSENEMNDSIGSDEEQTGEKTNIEERKIIYKVRADIDTLDLEKTIKDIRLSLKDNGWFDNEEITKEWAYLIIRVKSEKLDDFISSFNSYGEVSNYNKTATDVSLSYQNYQLKISSLEAELQRLIELKSQASINDLIVLNKRISEIEMELLKYNGAINEYDSLIDYSEVTLKIYQQGTVDNTSFSKKLSNAFKWGFSTLKEIIKYLIIIIVALFPFAVVIAPITFGILYISKKNKKKALENINNDLNKKE